MSSKESINGGPPWDAANVGVQEEEMLAEPVLVDNVEVDVDSDSMEFDFRQEASVVTDSNSYNLEEPKIVTSSSSEFSANIVHDTSNPVGVKSHVSYMNDASTSVSAAQHSKRFADSELQKELSNLKKHKKENTFRRQRQLRSGSRSRQKSSLSSGHQPSEKGSTSHGKRGHSSRTSKSQYPEPECIPVLEHGLMTFTNANNDASPERSMPVLIPEVYTPTDTGKATTENSPERCMPVLFPEVDIIKEAVKPTTETSPEKYKDKHKKDRSSTAKPSTDVESARSSIQKEKVISDGKSHSKGSSSKPHKSSSAHSGSSASKYSSGSHHHSKSSKTKTKSIHSDDKQGPKRPYIRPKAKVMNDKHDVNKKWDIKIAANIFANDSYEDIETVPVEPTDDFEGIKFEESSQLVEQRSVNEKSKDDQHKSSNKSSSALHSKDKHRSDREKNKRRVREQSNHTSSSRGKDKDRRSDKHLEDRDRDRDTKDRKESSSSKDKDGHKVRSKNEKLGSKDSRHHRDKDRDSKPGLHKFKEKPKESTNANASKPEKEHKELKKNAGKNNSSPGNASNAEGGGAGTKSRMKKAASDSASSSSTANNVSDPADPNYITLRKKNGTSIIRKIVPAATGSADLLTSIIERMATLKKSDQL